MNKGFVKLSFLTMGLLVVFAVFAIISAAIVSNRSQKQDLRSKAAPATTIAMNPNRIQVLPDSNFSLTPIIYPNENLVTATEIYLTFNPANVELLSVNPNLTDFPEVLGEYGKTIPEKIKIDNVLGKAHFSLGVSQTRPLDHTANIAVLNFKAKNLVSTSDITFDNNTGATALNEFTPSNVVISATGAQIEITNNTVSPTPTLTLSPTVTLTVSPTPTITTSPTPSLTLTPTVTPTPGPDCFTTGFSDNFSQSALDGNLWSLRNINGGSALLSASGGSLSLLAPHNSANSEGGVSTKHKLCGNFDIQVDFSNFQSGVNADVKKSTGVISLFISDGSNHLVIERLRNNSYDPDGFYTSLNIGGQAILSGDNQWKSADKNNTGGKLRIQRTNSTFYTYFDQGQGWQLLAKYTASSNLLNEVNAVVRVGSWGNDYPAVSAVVDNFVFSQSASPLFNNMCLSPFTETFNDMASVLKNWNYKINGPQSQLSVNNQALSAAVINNQQQWQDSGLYSYKSVCGDFDLQIDVSGFNPEAENNTVATMHFEPFEFDNSGNRLPSSVYIEIVQNGTNRSVATNLRNNAGVWQQFYSAPLLTDFAKLRIRRINQRVDTFYNNDNAWILLGSYDGVNYPTNGTITFEVSSREPNRPNISAVFDNFVLNTPANAANPTIKIKFNSLDGNINNNSAKNVSALYEIRGGTGEVLLSGNTVFTATGSNGNYAAVFYGLPTGNTTIWIKPQKFLARKFDVNLTSGASNKDLTSTLFLAGDLDDSQISYNKIDIFDIGKLVQDFGPLMPTAGSIADMDKNGKVDIFDFGFLTQGFNQTGAN